MDMNENLTIFRIQHLINTCEDINSYILIISEKYKHLLEQIETKNIEVIITKSLPNDIAGCFVNKKYLIP